MHRVVTNFLSRAACRFTLVTAVVVTRAVLALATDVTSCGQIIETGDTGVLQADLDCSSSPEGVLLRPFATLDLNGYAITGGSGTYAVVRGIGDSEDLELAEYEKGSFTIVGPGTISGVILNPNFHSGTYACVAVNEGYAKLTSATGSIDIHDCVFGVVGTSEEYSQSRARADIDHTVLHDNVLEGVTLRQLVVDNVTAYGNGGAGVHAINKMVATNVVAYDNFAQGVFATRKLKRTNITAYNNAIGVESFRKVDVTGLVATGNTVAGALSLQRLKLTDSNVTGNGVPDQRDVVSVKRPKLFNTTCGTSVQQGGSVTWGLCSND